MAIVINGYSLNQPGEAADWSTREYNLLSAFAGLMPVAGSRVVSAGEHYHTVLTNASGSLRITITSNGIEFTTAEIFTSLASATSGGTTTASPVTIDITNVSRIEVQPEYNISSPADGEYYAVSGTAVVGQRITVVNSSTGNCYPFTFTNVTGGHSTYGFVMVYVSDGHWVGLTHC